jgi:pilus assembly protein CpaF
MFVLVVTEKGGSQQRLQFEKESISIGRVHGNDVVLPRGNVSKRHSKLTFKGGVYTLTDMGSTNGTYVNGRRVPEQQTIDPGDKIYVGDFILHVDTGPSRPPDEPPRATAPQAFEGRPSDSPKPVVLSEKSEIAPPPPKKSRPSAAPSAPRPSDGPKEKRVPLPKPTVPMDEDTISTPPHKLPGRPPTAQRETLPNDDEVLAVVEKIFSQIAKKVQRISGTNAPTMVEPRVAGQIRAEIYAMVDTKQERGELAFPLTPQVLKGMVFRQAVYLGPLADWLVDPEVDRIRIFGPQSISLLKGGKWEAAVQGFMSKEELSQIILCLAAGLKTEEAGPAGTRRFRVEEGYFVYTALSQNYSFVTIDKTMAKRLEAPSGDLFGETGSAAIEEALNVGGRIAIVGQSGAARKQVYHRLLSMVPPGAFIVSLEDLPLDIPLDAQCLRLPIQRPTEGSSRFRATLSNAIGLEPSWLGVSAVNWFDIPDLLSALAVRGALIADLPLGATASLDRELGTVMASAGVSLGRISPGALLSDLFDLVIVAYLSETAGVGVRQIYEPALDRKGMWAPRVVWGS